MSNIVDKLDALIDSRLPQSPEALAKRKNRILKPLAFAAGLALIAGGVKIVDLIIDTTVAQAEHVEQVGGEYLNQPQDGIGYVDDTEIEP